MEHLDQDQNKNVNIKFKDLTLKTFILTGEITDPVVFNNLKLKIKKHTETSGLNYKTNVQGLFSGFDSLINDEDFLKTIDLMHNSIKLICKDNFYINSSWGNILKKGDEVLEHYHGNYNGFCGILYLTEGGPGTYFSEYDLTIEEKIGRYILFSPFVKHGVKKIDYDIERFTLAFNTSIVRSWEKNKNHAI